LRFRLRSCEQMERCLNQLSSKFKATKFVKIRAREAIRNYPDRNLPTLLIYKEGDVRKQFITLKELGGESMTVKGAHNMSFLLNSMIFCPDLEWALAKLGTLHYMQLLF